MFANGDIVFVKIKGFPHWPAKVLSIDNESEKIIKYNVVFFGTNETACVKQNCIANYLDNKEKYGKMKTENFKNSKFNMALVEADEFIKGSEMLLATESEEVYTSDNQNEVSQIFELNQQVIDLSESLSQIHFEKDKIENSFSLLQEEAEDALKMLQSKVDVLKQENVLLKKSIQSKDMEICTLRRKTETVSVAIQCELKEQTNSNIIEYVQNSNMKKCVLLQGKIKELEKMNSALMDRIDYYPIPQPSLLNEIDTVDKKIIDLEQSHQNTVNNLNKIIEMLSADLEYLKSENDSLKNNFNKVSHTFKTHKQNLQNPVTVNNIKESFIHKNRYEILAVNEKSDDFRTGTTKTCRDYKEPTKKNNVTKKTVKNNVTTSIVKNNNSHQLNRSQIRKSVLPTQIDRHVHKPILIYGDSMLKFLKISDAKTTCIGGINSDKLCDVLRHSEERHLKPKVLFIHVGTNDLSRYKDADVVMGKIYNVLVTAKECFPHSLIVMNSVMIRRDIHPLLIRKTNANIRWLCKQHEAIFLDINKYFSTSCLARDGLHPNKFGVTVLSRAMSNVYTLYKEKFYSDETSSKSTTSCPNQHCSGANKEFGVAVNSIKTQATIQSQLCGTLSNLTNQQPYESPAPQLVPHRSLSLDSLEEFPPLPSLITTTADIHSSNLWNNNSSNSDTLLINSQIFTNKLHISNTGTEDLSMHNHSLNYILQVGNVNS